MLRVNLLKNRGGTNAGTVASQVSDFTSIQSTGNDGLASDNKATATKIIVMVIWVVGLFTYQKYNINNLSDRLANLQFQDRSLQAQIQKNQVAANRAKQMEKDVKELQRRIKIIKDLSNVRLQDIKAISYIQNNIPDKVWLKSITFKSSKLDLVGSSLTDDQLNQFLNGLESKKSYFKNVLLLKAVDEPGRAGTVTSFEISSELGTFE